MKSKLALLTTAAALMLAGCASQPPQTSQAKTLASLNCQYLLAVDARNYDAAYLASGRPAVDDDGNTYGLSLRGHVAYMECMSGKGHQLAEGANLP